MSAENFFQRTFRKAQDLPVTKGGLLKAFRNISIVSGLGIGATAGAVYIKNSYDVGQERQHAEQIPITETISYRKTATAMADSTPTLTPTPEPTATIASSDTPTPSLTPDSGIQQTKDAQLQLLLDKNAALEAHTQGLETTVVDLLSVNAQIIAAMQSSQTAQAAETVVPTATLTSTATLTQTEAPTPVAQVDTQTPVIPTLTIVEPSPSQVKVIATATPTIRMIQAGVVSSYLQPATEKLSQNVDGLEELDMTSYIDYLGKTIERGGYTEKGDVDFHAQMLAKPFGKNGMPTSHALNFWMDKNEGGLDWKVKDSQYIYDSVDDMRYTPLDDVFSNRGDGTFRLEIKTTAKNFENAVAYATIVKYLHKAGLWNASIDQIKAHLSDPKVSANIKDTTDALIATSGYHALNGKQAGISNWPGAVAIFQGDVNFKPDNFNLCITDMAIAETRDDQKEESNPETYTLGLEKPNPLNDQTVNKSDSNGQVIIDVLYNSKAPDGKDIRVDIGRVTSISDKLNSSIVPPEDGQPVWVQDDKGRWIECGAIVRPTPLKKFVPVTTSTSDHGPKRTFLIPTDEITPSKPTATYPRRQLVQATRTPGGNGQQPVVPSTAVNTKASVEVVQPAQAPAAPAASGPSQPVALPSSVFGD